MASVIQNISNFLGFSQQNLQVEQKNLTIQGKIEPIISKSFDFPGAMVPESAYVYGYNNSTGQSISSYTAINSSNVYRCVKLIADSISKLPLKLLDQNNKEIKNHPLVDLFDEPNTLFTYDEFIGYIVFSLELHGNAIVYIDRARNGDIERLIPINFGNASWWYNQAGAPINVMSGEPFYNVWHPYIGQKTLVPQKDIIHIKNIMQNGLGYEGISTISAAQNVIGINLAQNKFVGKSYSQNVISNLIITPPESISPEAYVNAKAAFKKTYVGSDHSSETVFMPPGGWKGDNVQINNKDQQLLESREFQVTEIGRWFGVPLSKLNPSGDKPVSSYEQENLEFVEDCIVPKLKKIERAFARKLLTKEERNKIKIKFDTEELNVADMTTRTDTYKTGVMYGWYNCNEIRAKLGEPPIAGKDSYEQAQVYRVPANTVDPNDAEQVKPEASVDPEGGTNSDNI
jgi:HK97 family phage portal protein